MDAFEKWHHLLEETQHANHCVFRPQEFIVFHDNSCFESTPSLVGIVFVSILICHHISLVEISQNVTTPFTITWDL